MAQDNDSDAGGQAAGDEMRLPTADEVVTAAIEALGDSRAQFGHIIRSLHAQMQKQPDLLRREAGRREILMWRFNGEMAVALQGLLSMMQRQQADTALLIRLLRGEVLQ